MDRGCCCWTLETCVKVQGIIVALVCALNIGRILFKTASPDEFDSPLKRTCAGVYLDGVDFLVNGVGAVMLLVACILLVRGIRQKRPALLQPYLVVAVVVVASLAVYAVLYGVAVIQSLPEDSPDRFPERGDVSPGEVIAIVVAILLLLVAFPTYFLLNVSSLMDYMSSDCYRIEHFYYIGT